MATPLCRHFGPCGGCDSQHLTYGDQLERKRRDLTALLTGTLGARAPEVSPVLAMTADTSGWPWHFRHKASFVFGDAPDGRGAALGHYGAHSRHFVPIVECPVHASRANHIAFALQAQLTRAHVSPAGPALRGVLRHLIVRTTRDEREAVAMLVVTRNDKALRPPIRNFLATEDAPDGFYLNIHDKPGPHMIGHDTRRLAGRSHVREAVAGASFLVSPTTFFQTNVEAATALVRLVLELSLDRPAMHVLDLYAGSGLFTIPLALRGHRVTAVEENAEAVHDAESNVRLNRIPGGAVRLLTARVEDALRRVAREPVDQVVLDPPRQGCPPSVIHAVFERMRPAAVVHVSCNPEALAAELPSMLDAGYAITRVQPVDMFPHTSHIETVVRLEPTAKRRRLSGIRRSGQDG